MSWILNLVPSVRYFGTEILHIEPQDVPLQVRQVGALVRGGGQHDPYHLLRVRVRLQAASLDPDIVLAVPQVEPAAILHHFLVVLFTAVAGGGSFVED
jgi:hypothetical protein